MACTLVLLTFFSTTVDSVCAAGFGDGARWVTGGATGGIPVTAGVVVDDGTADGAAGVVTDDAGMLGEADGDDDTVIDDGITPAPVAVGGAAAPGGLQNSAQGNVHRLVSKVATPPYD